MPRLVVFIVGTTGHIMELTIDIHQLIDLMKDQLKVMKLDDIQVYQYASGILTTLALRHTKTNGNVEPILKHIHECFHVLPL
jgi:hypothetical protein